MERSLFAFGLLVSLAAAGCATGNLTDDDGGLESDGGTEDAGLKPDAKEEAGTKDAASSCPKSCTTDLQCQNSCPAVPNGIECCDTGTGVCYANASTKCPAPVKDAGFD